MSTTTSLLIRNRALTVVEALTPANLSGTKFRRYRNEGGADFVKWAIDNPAGALRRFQIRDDGSDNPPEVTNTTEEQIKVVFNILVAYPQDSRAGANNALDRDDLINADFDAINDAIGMYGRVNFTPPLPDAVPLPYTSKSIARGSVCDILEITQPYLYYRAVEDLPVSSPSDQVNLTNGNASAVPICTPVYSSGAGSYDKAIGDTAAHALCIGLVTATTAAGAQGLVQTGDIFTATATQWDTVAGTSGGLTYGTLYYVSPSSAGTLTSTAPTTSGQYVTLAGVALSTTQMRLILQPPIGL